MSFSRTAGAAMIALLMALPAAAEGWSAVKFDIPEKVERATERSGKQITCTVYPDLMIRESDTDSPDPEDATLILRKGALPDCWAEPDQNARKLATSGQRFIGRKAGFLVFEMASTNGTMPFAVLDTADGRVLFEDVTTYEGVDQFAVEGGILRLGFRRGVQGPCSIPKQGAACWTRILREEKLPAAVAALPAPTRACAEAYRTDKASKDVESIVSFPVRLAWAEHLKAEAFGPIYCRPTP